MKVFIDAYPKIKKAFGKSIFNEVFLKRITESGTLMKNDTFLSIIKTREDFNGRFNRLRVYSNNDAGRCEWYPCAHYGCTQGTV